MDSQLTGLIKHHAFTLGADLVGIANIERFANAPLPMSPQGLLPEAVSVIVCALHHPDGCIEIGGREHPQKMGPYAVQGLMNTHLDHMSYEMSRFVEDQGFLALPIAASNIWRYRNYKDLNAVFAPDMSHIYAAVAAGLTELGYHGISMSPEFGPRNRFVSIITTAPLDPTPLQPGNTLCDRCNECVKHCLSGALSEEVDGTVDLVIEDRRYTKANKNLWRCSWGEHFGVDLDLPKPAVVTEENILETIREHGLRGGEMGSCLRHCLPKHLRVWDRDYTNAPRRKRAYVPDDTVQENWVPRYVQDAMTAAAYGAGVDFVWVHDAQQMQEIGLDYQDRLPDAVSGVTMGVAIPQGQSYVEVWSAGKYFAERAAYLAARKLENLGYSIVVCSDLPMDRLAPAVAHLAPEGWEMLTATFLTSAPLTADEARGPGHPGPATGAREIMAGPGCPGPRDLTRALKQAALASGADVVGIASPDRLTALKAQLAPLMDGEMVLSATNKGKMWLEYDVEVTDQPRVIKDAADHLPGAQAVVVMGLRLPEATVARVGEPPAEAVGPYVFAQYIVQWILREKALILMKWLHARGYQAEMTLDLMGAGSMVANPRGPQHSVFSNRFAAVAAGLGAIAKGGFLATPDFGANLRTVSVITDAPLSADALHPDMHGLTQSCAHCRVCMESCPPQAYGERLTLTLEDQEIKFHRLDQRRCDWCAKFALMGGDGFANLGVDYEVAPPEEITAEALHEAMRGFDAIQGHHRCAAESCVVKCPLS
jgi:epoxyqueuosine reductase QueG